MGPVTIRQTMFYRGARSERQMEVALKKMGNSTAVVIPPPVLRDLGMGVDPKAPPPADLALWDPALWDLARPVGGEVL